MQLSISEVLQKAREFKSVDEKVQWLKKNESVPLKTILKYMYDPSEKTLLPEGAPPYNPSKFPDSHGMLYTEARRLKIFYKGNGYDNLKPLKRESVFINILEGVDKDDALLLIDMKDKKKIAGLTSKTINAAFPNLLPESKK
jgi:hypothetical protein